MKKIQFIGVVLMLTISILSLVKCNSNESLIEEKDELRNKIPLGLVEMKKLNYDANKMGKIHNLGLSLFIKNNPNYIYTGFNDLTEDINKEFIKGKKDYKLESSINYKSLNFYNKSILKSKNASNKSYSELMDSFIDGNVSKDVQSIFNKISINKFTFEETNNFVNKEIANNKNLSIIEIETLNTFIVIAKHSNDFWTNYIKNEGENIKSLNRASMRCDAASQRYMSDAFGFITFGGLGSIGMSWLVYEMQEDRGGSCI